MKGVLEISSREKKHNKHCRGTDTHELLEWLGHQWGKDLTYRETERSRPAGYAGGTSVGNTEGHSDSVGAKQKLFMGGGSRAGNLADLL